VDTGQRQQMEQALSRFTGILSLSAAFAFFFKTLKKHQKIKTITIK
jgi:hypothetical protein